MNSSHAERPEWPSWQDRLAPPGRADARNDPFRTLNDLNDPFQTPTVGEVGEVAAFGGRVLKAAPATPMLP
jgi:hypothetical protein